MSASPVHFDNLQPARFVDRPNQFLVRCRTEGGGLVRAFLPNPGRMLELMFPDVTIYLTKEPRQRRGKGASPPRKTRYTVVAVERDGRPLFLHTHMTNAVARYLIENSKIPTLADAEIVDSEVTVGRSRFDFLLRDQGRLLYLEVKSCTLYGNGVAMFPDAVTERGRKHLLELAEMARQGMRPVVLFVVHTPLVRWFMPDYHTDLAFSRTMLAVRDQLRILPVSVSWTRDFRLGSEVRMLDIPWNYLHREVEDRGSYLLILRLKRKRRVTVGQLGALLFERGYYLYVGSAMGSLSPRIARHTRLRKKLRWHVDYLRQVADEVVPLPVVSSKRLECDMASALSGLLGLGPPRFGSSDCDCPTYLFWSIDDPLDSRDFHHLLQRFRMQEPDIP